MGAFFFLNGLLGFALSAVVWQGAPGRPENRWLALAGCIDAGTAVALGLVYAAGHRLDDPIGTAVCVGGRLLICYPLLYFTHVFPFGLRPPRALSAVALAATAVALPLAVHPATSLWFCRTAPWSFYLPLFLLTVVALARNSRRFAGQIADPAGVRLVLLAVVGRWAVSLVTWGVARGFWPTGFLTLGILDNTVSVLVSYLIVSHAILRHQLFRVRGVLAEAALWGMAGAVVLGVVVLGVSLVQAHLPSPALARVALVSVAAVPVGLLVALQRLGPRIEAKVLGPLDPRRAKRHGTLEQVVSDSAALVEPGPLLALTCQALAGVAGGNTRFLAGPALDEVTGASQPHEPLPPALADHLAAAAAAPLHPPVDARLPAGARAAFTATGAALLVPVRLAGRLYGALATSGGTIDRDTLLTAVALADNLAGKLERCLLFQGRLLLQSELEETRRLAALGSFAAAVAHDIRTPLTSVQMNVQMLRRKVQLPPADMESFDIALDELRRLDDHVSEILDFAKPLRLHPSPVDLRELSDEAARRLLPLLAERRLTLEQRHPPELPLVDADPQRLRQVLMNLVDNAACASPSGAAIVISTRPGPPGTVAIEVSDQGKGIAPEHLPKIFEPFFTTRADGTGLGLAIVHKVVKAHGGEIDVRSRPGQGATFTVLLPARA
jgi:signal transduction histidine kinase